jgi:type IV pilus assembly protein PilM
MAKSTAVWGIDIGQCALKALRCTASSDGETIVADKYDYIEYPKMLSQADADPEELVRDALEQFLSRNNLIGDKVAVSVPGQAGLSRFFKPPPVDAKTLPEIVKYEVTQQIPFPIEDVIWDWQQLGGTVVDGRTVDAEVGLFAMKREAVYRALSPFDDAKIEVDFVQLSPLSIFNVVCQDLIDELPDPESFDPDNPPPSIVVMSMGTDTTDMIVTNGMKLWLRNIPIGGSHFTKQLSRQMKLTQAKAEHLKRNARLAENPKEVFQAMRPVFNDLINEVQRSLTFFQSMDKSAEIQDIVLLGNAAKLPGLRQYLNKQLEIDVRKVDSFEKLSGEAAAGQKSFDENLLSFAPCYGLCLQGLSKAQLKTNLLPNELVVERIVKAKKPWVLASVGLLMLGCVLGLFFKQNALWAVSPDYKGTSQASWSQAITKAKSAKSKSSGLVETDQEQKEHLKKLNLIAKGLSSATDNKTMWMEMYSALFQALPKDPKIEALREQGITTVSPQEVPFAGRAEIYIDHLETKYFPDLAEWYEEVKDIYDRQTLSGEELRARVGGGDGDEDYNEYDDEEYSDDMDMDSTGPNNAMSGVAGWVIEIQAHHFHNFIGDESKISEVDYVRQTLINTIRNKDVTLPDGVYKYSDLGVSFPTIVRRDVASKSKRIEFDPAKARAAAMANGGPMGGMGEMGGYGGGMGDFGGGMGMGQNKTLADNETTFDANEFSFIVQMAWEPRTPSQRAAAKEARIKAAEDAAKAAAESAENPDEQFE